MTILETALLLAQASARTSAHIDSYLARIGVDFADLRRLRAIGAAADGVTWRDLAAEMTESRSQAVRSTRPLEKLGWVHSTDGRFALTDSGRHLLATAEEIAANAAAPWFADCGFSAAEVSEYLRPLATVDRSSTREEPAGQPSQPESE